LTRRRVSHSQSEIRIPQFASVLHPSLPWLYQLNDLAVVILFECHIMRARRSTVDRFIKIKLKAGIQHQIIHDLVIAFCMDLPGLTGEHALRMSGMKPKGKKRKGAPQAASRAAQVLADYRSGAEFTF
jgi:hypothetical protein